MAILNTEDPLAPKPNATGSSGSQTPGPLTFSQMQKQGIARPPQPTLSTQPPAPQSGGMYPGMGTPTGITPANPSQTRATPYTGTMQASMAATPDTPSGYTSAGAGAGGAAPPPPSIPGVTDDTPKIPMPTPSMGQPAKPQGPTGIPAVNPGQPVSQPLNQPIQNDPLTQNQGQSTDLGQTLQSQWQNYQMDPKIQQALSSFLGNPSAYNSDVVQQTYGMLNNQLSQGFNRQRDQVNNDAARRGVYFSSVPFNEQGGFNDLAGQQAQAQSNLATNLLNNTAQTYGQDRAASLQAALGGNQQGFNQQQQLLNNLLGYGQQQYNNQLNTAQFNQSQDVLNWQQLMQALGLGG